MNAAFLSCKINDTAANAVWCISIGLSLLPEFVYTLARLILVQYSLDGRMDRIAFQHTFPSRIVAVALLPCHLIVRIRNYSAFVIIVNAPKWSEYWQMVFPFCFCSRPHPDAGGRNGYSFCIYTHSNWRQIHFLCHRTSALTLFNTPYHCRRYTCPLQRSSTYTYTYMSIFVLINKENWSSTNGDSYIYLFAQHPKTTLRCDVSKKCAIPRSE